MSAGPDGPEDRLRRFATIWSRAVFPVTSTSSTRPEFEAQLLPLARRLSEALRARAFDADEGRAVGAALIASHCTDPEALASTYDGEGLASRRTPLIQDGVLQGFLHASWSARKARRSSPTSTAG